MPNSRFMTGIFAAGLVWCGIAAGQEISIGTPVRSSEMRTFFPITDGGERYIIADVQDYAERGYLLKTDLKSGITTKINNPETVRQDDSFGALVTRDHHYFYSQAGVVLSCDLRSGEWRVWGRIDPETAYYFGFAEGPDGRIWCGGYPKANLLAIDRATGKVTNYGRLDPREAYLMSIAFDSKGLLYGAIAHARRDLVCFDPATGKKQSLLPDELRKNGRLHLFRGADGAVYSTVDGKTARMFDGRLEFVAEASPRDDSVRNATYLAAANKKFADGTEVLLYDTENRRVSLLNPDGSLRTLELGEHSGGTKLSGKTLAADGKLYFSSGHPMHLGYADLKTGKLHDYGPIPYVAGGTFSVMRTAPDGKIYGGQYAGGGLWVFDPAKKWMHPGMTDPLFGTEDPVALSRSFSSAPASRRVRLIQPDVILFSGSDDHVKKFPVPAAGRYFINLMFLKTPQYGALEVEVDGKRCGVIDTNSATVGFTPATSVEVALEPGEHTLTLRSTDAKRLFGMAGFEISTNDRAKEFRDNFEPNPRNLGFWIDEAGQPRGMVVSPDNRRVLMGGLAGYGLAGGKIIDYDIASGKARIVDALAPGESVERLEWCGDRRVAIATTIRTQGGGQVVAKDAAVKLYDANTGTIVAARSFEGERIIGSVLPWGDYLAAVGGGNKLYLLDPQALELKKTVDLAKLGYVTVTFTPLIVSPAGKLYIFASKGIWEMASPDAEVRCILDSPQRAVTSGAACWNDRLYFIRSHELCAIDLQKAE